MTKVKNLMLYLAIQNKELINFSLVFHQSTKKIDLAHTPNKNVWRCQKVTHQIYCSNNSYGWLTSLKWGLLTTCQFRSQKLRHKGIFFLFFGIFRRFDQKFQISNWRPPRLPKRIGHLKKEKRSKWDTSILCLKTGLFYDFFKIYLFKNNSINS